MDVVTMYERMSRRDISKVLLLEYRCPKGCLLLHVWNTRAGRLWFQPRHKLSESRTLADTVEEARRKRTEDGFRVWKARGGDFDEFIDFFDFDPTQGGLSMNCDHVREAVVLCDQLHVDADAATPGNPTRHTVSNTYTPPTVSD